MSLTRTKEKGIVNRKRERTNKTSSSNINKKNYDDVDDSDCDVNYLTECQSSNLPLSIILLCLIFSDLFKLLYSYVKVLKLQS